MHVSNIISFTLGCVVGGCATWVIVNKLQRDRKEEEISQRVIEEVESYKRSLDKAADNIISVDAARELVREVQSELKDSDVPVKSFSSLDETLPEDNREPEAYNTAYDRYNDVKPSQLFNYDDDIPKEVLDNQLDLEAELVIQNREKEIEEFEQMLAERESPEEDFDPEAMNAKRRRDREVSKRVYEITDDDFFNGKRDYDKETLLFYKKDRILCFENEDIVLDKEEILGPDSLGWLDTFSNTRVNSEKGKSLYLRSDYLHTDYEIIIYAGSYEHFVAGPDIN